MDSHSRKLPLQGAWNVRDLGGLPSASGALTCPRRYLRGDSPANLTGADVRLLASIGVGAVIDLREPAEAAAQPSRLLGSGGMHVHQVPLFGELDAIGSPLPTQLGELYVLCLRRCGGALRRVFELLGSDRGAGESEGAGAVLFHCAVGKDRTGIVAALLLERAGVSRASIVADYMESEANLQKMVGRWIAQYESDPATGYHPDLLHCLPQNIERMLDVLAGQYGGAAAYLRRAGLSEASLERIRRRLLPGAGTACI